MATNQLYTALEHKAADIAQQRLQLLDIKMSREALLESSRAALQQILASRALVDASPRITVSEPVVATQPAVIGQPIVSELKVPDVIRPTISPMNQYVSTTYALIPDNHEFYTVDLSKYNIAEMCIDSQQLVLRLKGAYVSCNRTYTVLRSADQITCIEVAVNANYKSAVHPERSRGYSFTEQQIRDAKNGVYRATFSVLKTRSASISTYESGQSYELARAVVDLDKSYNSKRTDVTIKPNVTSTSVYRIYNERDVYCGPVDIPAGTYYMYGFNLSVWRYRAIVFDPGVGCMIALHHCDLNDVTKGKLTNLDGNIELINTKMFV